MLLCGFDPHMVSVTIPVNVWGDSPRAMHAAKSVQAAAIAGPDFFIIE